MPDEVPKWRPSLGLVAELFFWGLVMASLVHVIWTLLTKGYLPQPFIFLPYDTFMDWFNPAWWAHNQGAYEAFQSVYPPIAFVFLRLLSDSSCYMSDGTVGRECDQIGLAAIIIFWLLGGVTTFLVLRKVDRSTALIRATALLLGMPMLYGFERGNLILPCYVAFVLAHSRILKSARLKWLAHAVAINFKPYLILTLIPLISQRRWRWFEGAALASLALYLLTFALQQGGSPVEILASTKALSASLSNGNWTDIYYPTSFDSIVRFITSNNTAAYYATTLPVSYYTGTELLEIMVFWLPIIMMASQLGVIICLGLSLIHPGSIRPRHLNGAFCAMILSASSPSGYAQVFMIFFVFMEPWRGPTRITMLISAYILSISYDRIFLQLYQPFYDSWLTGLSVQMDVGIAYGQFLRPVLILVIQWCFVSLMMSSLVRNVLRKRAREILTTRRILRARDNPLAVN